MSLKKKIIKRVSKKVTDMSLILPGERVLVAFSGGADSVSLLYILNSIKEEIGFELFAVHLNHGLRGAAADKDEAFSEAFCESLGVPLTVFKRDVREYAREHGISEELAGRELRYSLFFDVMKEKNIGKLAVGHHADDQAETVLMHLMRGSGLDGLSGMRYMRDNIIRPMLDVTKEEILELCREEKLEFCTDATNFEAVYSRNKVRIELLPKMNEFNPGISKTLTQTAEILSDEADFLESATTAEYQSIVDGKSCEIKKLKGLHIAIRRRIIRKMTEAAKKSKKDISADFVNKVLELAENAVTGKEISFGHICARIEYGKLIIDEKCEAESFLEKIKPEEIVSKNGFCFKIEKVENGDFCFCENAELSIRSRLPGDRIYPLGISGSKKLKDFFIDAKVPRGDREKAVLLLCNNEIAVVFYGEKLFFDRRFYKKGKGTFEIIFERNDF